jgi:hypothetical protein
VNNSPVNYTDPSGHICVNNHGGNDEVAMAGNCGGGENPHYDGGLLGSSSGWENGDDNGGNGGGGEEKDDPPVISQGLGNPTAGMSYGGGEPNSFVVSGYTIEEQGDMLYTAGVGAGLVYNATYGIQYFENGAIITVNENYRLSPNTFYTTINTAGAVLNFTTTDGVSHQEGLGEFDIDPHNIQNRVNNVMILNVFPENLEITIYIELSDSTILTAPLTSYIFNNQPSYPILPIP